MVRHIIRPRRPTTIVEKIMYVLAYVVAFLSKCVQDDSDDDSTKGICGRISFFSPLTRKSVFILSCIAVSIDPLFFYIPIIDEKDKCLGIDKNLRTAALIFRALLDAAFALRTIISGYKFYTDVADEDDTQVGTLDRIYSCGIIGFAGILIAVSLMLPIPQLAIAVFFFKSGGSGHFGQRVTVNIFLFIHYVARLVLIYLFSRKVQYNTGIWVRAAFNFFFYMVASNILGGFWYFFSIQREISCWQSCRNALGCGATYCSDSTSRDITFRDELCPINPQNTTIFNFGIFFEAIQSGTTRSLHFPTKFFYGLWWGFRNLSNFGTNLQTSSYVWETCFALVISITGLLLFLYLIGNVQIYMQHAKSKSLKAEEKLKKLKAKIQMWMKVNGIPDDIARNIKQEINNDELVENYKNDKVDVHYMFSILRWSRMDLQCHFCMDILKKVNRLQNMEEYIVARICYYMTLEMFDENKYVVESGKPHKLMIIVEGSVRVTYQATIPERVISGRELVDETLLDWAATTQSFNDPPTSVVVSVQCITKVAAFILTIEDSEELDYIFHMI